MGIQISSYLELVEHYCMQGQIMHTAKQLGCDLPIYLENATDFLYEGNAKFNEKSIVVIASLSGNTIEIEAAIDKAHEVGAKVMGYVEVLNSPLAKKLII